MAKSIRQLNPVVSLDVQGAELLQMFPFHIIVDSQLNILEYGHSFKLLDASFEDKTCIAECFEIVSPIEIFCLNTLLATRDELCLLRHKASGMLLGGKVAAHQGNNLAFLLSPWIADTQEVSQAQFDRSSPHLQLLSRAKFKALESARNTKRKLTVQKKQLFQAHALLSIKESESRTLTHIVSMSDNSVVIANSMGYIEWVNEAYVKRSGYHAEEVLGRYLGDLLDADEGAVKQIKERLELKQGYQAELLRKTKSGDAYWVDLDIEPLLDSQGNICNYIAIARDITEKKNALEFSSRLLGILKSTFELSPDGFVTFNQFGQLTWVNPSFLRMTGLVSEQMENITQDGFERLIASLCPECDAVSDLDLHDAVVMRVAKPKLTVIKRSMRQAHDENNRFVGTIHYFRDITQESELHRMKGEFLSMAAHELRTPMSSIHGFTELLLKREFNAEQQKDMLSTVHRQSTRLTKLINDLLDLAKIEARKGMAFDIKPYKLVDIVDTALKEFVVNGEGREIDYLLNEQTLMVAVDFDKIIQALMNVLSNAHKYSQPGSMIKLEILEKQKHKKVYLGISVQDHGIGMSQEHLSRLFERFYRADTSGNVPGTGLGLCLVKEIMEIHDGWIDVSSIYGVGTQVTLWMKKLEAVVDKI
ncbi:PAS domain S-box protein [Methylobacillus gramineus]|uniref:PAS domain-containing protein n=1 Tax=Methylobacillus gramineus TaxID=755169 RepID=UPI001CFFDDDC|nr:PAS domain-containing protein [Methylobacillus gramineus]MCB5184138.1 PAS domain S-box protein [Methylobacillus gramineus]